MGRPTKKEQAKREQFLRGLFTKEPELTAREANERLHGKLGVQMSAANVYKIKNDVTGHHRLASDGGMGGISSKDDIVLYKQIEEAIKTVIARIDGLRQLHVEVDDDGEVKFGYIVDRRVSGGGDLKL